MEKELEGGFAVLLVVSKMGEEEWNPGVLAVVLAICGVVFGRVGEEGCVGWEDGIEDDHSADGGVEAAGSRGGDAISV